MSKVIKRYQLLTYLQLATSFMVNGTSIPVTFKGGITNPYIVRGRFSTDDPDMQEAIESDVSFGKLFYLEHTYDEDQTVAAKVETSAPEAEIDSAPEVSNEPEQPAVGSDETETVNVPEQPADVTDVPASPKVDDGKPVITDYPEVTNLQEARQKMFELFPGEFKPANLPNKSAVLNKVKDKNITFSKLV